MGLGMDRRKRIKTKMKVDLYLAMCLLLAMFSLSLLFVTNYPSDFAEWNTVIKKRASFYTGWTDFDFSEYSEGSVAEKEDLSKEDVRSCLERSVGNVDTDLLEFDVERHVRTMPGELRVRDSRVMYKMQQALRRADSKCVIRIGKYCSTRCSHLFGNISQDWHSFECRDMTACTVETRFISQLNPEIMVTVDVLVIIDSLHKRLHLDQLMAWRPPGQIWVLYSRESPQHDPEYAPPSGTPNPYNISMTYSTESDISIPYCHFKEQHVERVPKLPAKTKLMAWMASNCHLLSWRRGEFVEELQKHLPIDTYGNCGKLGRLAVGETMPTLQKYKFYLALENSECNDYVTEKMWRTPLLNGIVPIVYGAKRTDYERIAPPDSFIHVEDFRTMEEFADFIRALDADDARYAEYLAWRKRGRVVCHSARYFIMVRPRVNLCYLLRKIAHVHLYPDTSWHNRVPDFRDWWLDECSDPSKEKNLLGFNVHQPRQNHRKGRHKT